MPYSEDVLRRAMQRLQQSVEEKRAENEAHLQTAYEKYPRLREIDRRLRQSVAEAISVSFSRGEDTQAAVARLAEENLRLQDERQWILDASEFEEGFLDDSPICTDCGGKGYVGARMCGCLHELCRQEQKRELAALLPTGAERFENFRLDFYPDVYEPTFGNSPRRMMQSNLGICKRFAANFRPGAGNLLFSGATGLGKTLMSACIARQVTDGGASVTYVSIAKLIADYEQVQFGGADASLLRRYTDCDLLILDDLGTEMQKPFVNSVLYTVVNDRLHSLSTIVSTNLKPEDLEERYGPQIASRLLGCYQLLTFAGSDIRMQLRGKFK